MYKKAISVLILMSLLFLFSVVCVDGAALEMHFGDQTVDLRPDEEKAVRLDRTIGIVDTAVSDQRVLQLQWVEHQENVGTESATLEAIAEMAAQGEDYDLLLRIVEAEAGNQDADGRLLVANVVLNRVASDEFPNTVKEVVLQAQDGNYQFSPVANGRIWKVAVSKETKEAVERALNGEDISDGALYFVARQYADQSSVKWFDNHLTYLFEWGDHEFFK